MVLDIIKQKYIGRFKIFEVQRIKEKSLEITLLEENFNISEIILGGFLFMIEELDGKLYEHDFEELINDFIRLQLRWFYLNNEIEIIRATDKHKYLGGIFSVRYENFVLKQQNDTEKTFATHLEKKIKEKIFEKSNNVFLGESVVAILEMILNEERTYEQECKEFIENLIWREIGITKDNNIVKPRFSNEYVGVVYEVQISESNKNQLINKYKKLKINLLEENKDKIIRAHDNIIRWLIKDELGMQIDNDGDTTDSDSSDID